MALSFKLKLPSSQNKDFAIVRGSGASGGMREREWIDSIERTEQLTRRVNANIAPHKYHRDPNVDDDAYLSSLRRHFRKGDIIRFCYAGRSEADGKMQCTPFSIQPASEIRGTDNIRILIIRCDKDAMRITRILNKRPSDAPCRVRLTIA